MENIFLYKLFKNYMYNRLEIWDLPDNSYEQIAQKSRKKKNKK